MQYSGTSQNQRQPFCRFRRYWRISRPSFPYVPLRHANPHRLKNWRPLYRPRGANASLHNCSKNPSFAY